MKRKLNFPNEIEYVNIVITNCCFYRGGGKNSKRKPFRIRKFQNVHHRISKEKLEKYTDEQILNSYHGKIFLNGYPIWVTSTSSIKRKGNYALF